MSEGYALHSDGYTRQNQTRQTPESKKITECFQMGDMISIVLDGINGQLGFFKNGEYLGGLFSNSFKEKKYYPAVGIQGEEQYVGLTYIHD